MARRVQFSMRAMLVATSLVGVTAASLRWTLVIPYQWDFWAQATAFQVCMLSAGASFGWVVGMFLSHARIGAVLGMLSLTLVGWTLAIVGVPWT
jgi:hypothetical protein